MSKIPGIKGIMIGPFGVKYSNIMNRDIEEHGSSFRSTRIENIIFNGTFKEYVFCCSWVKCSRNVRPFGWQPERLVCSPTRADGGWEQALEVRSQGED